MFVCGVAGMTVNRRAPERHFTDNARDLIKLVVALTSTLSALVLSLLVASSYSLYTSQKTGLETLSARAIEINRMLVHYGPDAAPGREILKAALDEGWLISGDWKNPPAKCSLCRRPAAMRPSKPSATISKR